MSNVELAINNLATKFNPNFIFFGKVKTKT